MSTTHFKIVVSLEIRQARALQATRTMEIPSNDKRDYEQFTLPNGMRCLVISDPTADKAAAAVGVGAGQLHDTLPGIAHLTEHLLFLGTTRYPVENEYDRYLAEAGGHSNAYTDQELTCYYMDCQPSALEGALDRFSACLTGPLVKESSLEREIQAVDSEHGKNVQSDHWRSMQLSKTCIDSKHVYAGFGSGNLKTLLGDGDKAQRITQLRAAVWDFYQAHYHASNMTLTVQGCETLPKLKEWIVEYFGPVSSEAPTTTSPPPLQLAATKVVHYVPVRPTHTLEMQWTAPELQSLYKSKPAHAICHLVGHEGPGSLLYALQQLQWADELSADDMSKSCTSFSIFTVNIELTDLGLQNVDTVVQMVFYYLETACKDMPAWVLQELQTAGDMQFRFLSEQAPAGYVSGIAAHMHLYDAKHYLSGPYKLFEQDLVAVEAYRAHLRPETCLVMIASPTVAGTTDQTDPWYGTEYRVEATDDTAKRMQVWKTPLLAEYGAMLHLPAENDMLPTDFDLVGGSANAGKSDAAPSLPVCLLDTDTCRLWYKADDQFQMPKVNAMVLMRTEMAYVNSPTNSVLATLWSEVVHEQCNVFSYAASMAGLHCDFGNTRTGMEMHVSGYNHKAAVLLRRIIDTIQELPEKLTQALFSRIQDKIDKQFQAFMVAQPYQHAMYAADLLLERPKYPIHDRMACLKEVTLDDLVRFSRQLVSRMQLEVLMHGNVTSEEATTWSKILKDGFQPKAPFSLPQLRVVQLDQGRDYVYRLEGMNDQDTNSCVSNLFQVGVMDVRTNSALSVLHHLLREPAFNQLRTEEQLGYIVHSSVKTNGDKIKGLLILIQSDSFDPIHMDARIEVFLESFRTKLVNMTDEDFASNVDSVCQNLTQKDKNLSEESGKYWHVITNRSYRFRRLEDISEQARTLNKLDVLRLFDRYVLKGSPNRQKLSVQIFGSGHSEKMNGATDDILIKSPTEFGRGQSLFPVQTEVSIEHFMKE